MNKKPKKLSLHRETVKKLHDKDLQEVVGATNPDCSATRVCSGCCSLTIVCSTCCM